MQHLVQMSSVANQGLQASTSNPELVGRFKLESLPATSEIQEINDNPMNAPANADRTSSVETSIPLHYDLIPKIMDLLSLVGRKNDVVAAEYQETRFRARLSEGETFRPYFPEPRIENLRGGKSPSEIRQLRIMIASSKAQLQTQLQNLKLNQATLDLLKEELPSEGVAMLNSLQLPEANGYLPLRVDLEIDSIFGQVKGKILQILVLQQNVQIETNKLDFYVVSQGAESLTGDAVPDTILLSTLEPLSTEDVKKLPVRLHAALNEKTKPILQSIVELFDSLITERRAVEAHQWAQRADTRGGSADSRAIREEKIRFHERILDQSDKRTLHKESILDTSYSNVWNDTRTQSTLRAILGIASLRADVKDDFWGISALWAPIAISLIADCASVFLSANPLNESITSERNNVANERNAYEQAGLTLKDTLRANAPEGSSTNGLTDIDARLCIENGKPQNTRDTINARRLPPFSRVGQYFIPFTVTLLSAAIAAVRQSSLGDNDNMGSTISKEIEDFISHNGNLTFNGTIPGPFNLSGTLTP